MVAIDFHSRKKYYGNQWLPSTFWLHIFFKIASVVFNRRKKLIQVCNNMRMSTNMMAKFAYLSELYL